MGRPDDAVLKPWKSWRDATDSGHGNLTARERTCMDGKKVYQIELVLRATGSNVLHALARLASGLAGADLLRETRLGRLSSIALAEWILTVAQQNARSITARRPGCDSVVRIDGTRSIHASAEALRLYHAPPMAC